MGDAESIFVRDFWVAVITIGSLSMLLVERFHEDSESSRRAVNSCGRISAIIGNRAAYAVVRFSSVARSSIGSWRCHSMFGNERCINQSSSISGAALFASSNGVQSALVSGRNVARKLMRLSETWTGVTTCEGWVAYAA
jgi:hypothetical protein